MATSVDTEIKELIINEVESDDMLTEMESNGQIEPNQFFVTPDEGDISNFYPINSIYISTDSISPADSIENGGLGFGTWEQLPEGLALWTTTTEGEGGETIEAGLPNITGSINGPSGYGVIVNGTTGSGAFSITQNTASQSPSTGSTNASRPSIINFDANSGASIKGIYGNSTTVQPPAYKVYAWKRVG